MIGTRRSGPVLLVVLVLVVLGLGVVTGAVPTARAGTRPADSSGSGTQPPGNETSTVTGVSQTPLLIVMDLSGSMNEDDGTGVVKLAAAKDSLQSLVRGQPSGSTLGMWTYPSGQSDSNGCQPGGWVFGEGGQRVEDVPAWAASIDTLTADGETPTGPALRQAADGIKAQGFQTATIVLVSDGESNCGPDPCVVAEELADEGLEITIHAMGFQVSGDGAKELACVADAGGGVYKDVKDAAELRTSLDELTIPGLTLRVSAPTKAVPGQTVTVAVTVTNPSTKPVQDVGLSLSFTGSEGQAMFPAVLPPRLRLGNLPPGGERTHQWSIASANSQVFGDATYRVSAWGSGVGVVSHNGTISVAKDGDPKSAAGPWLTRLTAGNVVILGDSYSSGEGAGRYYKATMTAKNRCHRSPDTYAVSQFARSSIVACSGAVMSDLSGARYFGNNPIPPQLVDVRAGDEPVDVVFMSIGGNDINFGGIVSACVLLGDCTQGSLPADALRSVAWLGPPACQGELSPVVHSKSA